MSFDVRSFYNANTFDMFDFPSKNIMKSVKSKMCSYFFAIFYYGSGYSNDFSHNGKILRRENMMNTQIVTERISLFNKISIYIS